MDTTRHSIVKTYRYLRIAMVLLVLMLAASVLREAAAVGFDCAQKSLSAYYSPPARGVFVGALVAIGACLVVIKGSTDVEDVLLNIAGMLMPVVAFVPTPYEAACSSTPVQAAPQIGTAWLRARAAAAPGGRCAAAPGRIPPRAIRCRASPAASAQASEPAGFLALPQGRGAESGASFHQLPRRTPWPS